MTESQAVDPAVTQVKFDREVGRLREMEAVYRRRGVLLQKVSFPTVTIAFCGAKLRPAPLLGAVRIDFTDYDLQPPSVTFVDPLTHDELVVEAVAMPMFRFPKKEGTTREAMLTAAGQGVPVALTPLIIAHEPGGKPFLCLPGIREYHDNPAHSGDPWLIHRTSGEGCLAFIVDNIWKYGPNATERYLVQTIIQAPGSRIQAQIEVQQAGVAVALESLPE